jgi:ADP-ribosylglycohydrolase
MIDNRALLAQLMAEGRLDIARGALFDETPPPLPEGFDFDRVEGMLLGLAIGDSLGNSSEGISPAAREDGVGGEVRNYLPTPYAEGRAVGVPSDDTQLAFWTLEQLLQDGGLVPDHLADRFCRERVYGIGSTVRKFIAKRQVGWPWYECGPKSAGNGALMRIAPVLLPHLRQPSTALWADAALAAAVTHNDSAAIASSVAFVRMLWSALRGEAPPPGGWHTLFVATARDLERDARYRSRSPHYSDFVGPLWQFVQTEVGKALAEGWRIRDACDRWYSAAYLLETAPSVLFIVDRLAGDPEEAILRAVNDTKDNDTIAAIVGAFVGALHGARALPDRWRAGLLGRTAAADDGRVFELIAAAKAAF